MFVQARLQVNSIAHRGYWDCGQHWIMRVNSVQRLYSTKSHIIDGIPALLRFRDKRYCDTPITSDAAVKIVSDGGIVRPYMFQIFVRKYPVLEGGHDGIKS